ncbi:hypothetical protein GCM10011418_32880 [Sphingobacterium alkalisoli]|nr:hypothetical protein GCM10011418_32880 [Sphingobacterium alkalisoli]
MAFIGVQGEFQVNRYFELNCYQRAGEAPSFSVYEITQQWMTEDGKVTVFGRQRNWTYYHDTFTGGMEIRNWDPRTGKYDILPYKVYPKIKVLPIFKRNGFKRSFYKLTPYEMFFSILRDNRSETLLKANQPDLLNMRVGNQRGRVDRHWDSIKIAIRNGYKVKDAATWLDHLDLLQRFGKDLRNPKYVCSINLALDHRRMIKKREREDRRLALERKKKQIEQEQMEYVRNKGVFFDLVLSAGDITVRVLTSVKEFIEEADRFHHCVYANSYYKKPNSLIFSARVKGRPVETVEVDLGALKVIQSRGVHNRASAYNQQIVNLVNSNIHQIRKRLRKLEQTA